MPHQSAHPALHDALAAAIRATEQVLLARTPRLMRPQKLRDDEVAAIAARFTTAIRTAIPERFAQPGTPKHFADGTE